METDVGELLHPDLVIFKFGPKEELSQDSSLFLHFSSPNSSQASPTTAILQPVAITGVPHAAGEPPSSRIEPPIPAGYRVLEVLGGGITFAGLEFRNPHTCQIHHLE